MLDCLSGGRLEFGLGRGFQKSEYDAFECDRGDSRRLFEEAHALIKKAWTEDRFSFQGKFRQVRNITGSPKPVQKLPPFYVACIFTEESFAWTGAQGHNLMTVPYAAPTPKFINGRIATYQDARRAAGFTTPGEILGVYHFYCAQTREQAIADTRGPMMRYVQSVIDSNEEAAYSNPYQAYKSLSEAFRGVTYETLCPHQVVIGDPAQCAARIAEIRALKITNISLLADFGGIGQEQILGPMDRFAREVMPRV